MTDEHSTRSSYRELILEHLLLGRLLQHLWNEGGRHAEVLKSAVDDSGYDLVVDVGGRTRYIQLKSKRSGGKARSFTVGDSLIGKPGACVMLMVISEDLSFDHFQILEPWKALMDGLKVAKHTKANTQGTKGERPGHRVVPLSKFRRVDSIEGLASELFPIT